MVRRLLALLTLLASPPAFAVPCGFDALQPTALKTTPIASGGGVIIGLRSAIDPPIRPRPTDAEQKAWRFRDVNRLVVPTIRVIAPGLAVYELPPGTGPVLVLEDAEHLPVVTARRALDKQPDSLSAPKLVKATNRTMRNTERMRVGSIVDIKLGAPVPANAAAIVMFSAGKPLSWVEVTPQTTELTVFHQYRCDQTIPGVVEPRPGKRVVVAWLDASGRLSPMSKAVVVIAASR
jgi:hypothetical protein